MDSDPSYIVRELLVSTQGLPEVKVNPDARIVHDLGVDGDDAGELFEALYERFGTDFSELTDQWCLFFNTEGTSPKAILFDILAIVVCGGAAGTLVAALQWPVIFALGLVLALLVGGVWLYSRWFGRKLKPLTVGGLAEIVRAGRWPTDPADVR